jgi:microcystin-dependent protein
MPINDVPFGEVRAASLWNDMVSEINSLKEAFQTNNLHANKHHIAALLGLHDEQKGIILTGCAVQTTDDNKILQISAGWVLLDGTIGIVPAFKPMTAVTEAYLQKTGDTIEWSEKLTRKNTYITFLPYTSQYLSDVRRRNNAYIGEIRMMAVKTQDFDDTGLGRYAMLGWAICNGANGTVNLSNKTVRGAVSPSDIGTESGKDSVSLTVANMPPHNHQSEDVNQWQSVPQGGYGLIRKSASGENVTNKNFDSGASGTEPDVSNSPMPIPMQGSATPFSVVNKHLKVLFIQRIL